jgi:hypothetical protein
MKMLLKRLKRFPAILKLLRPLSQLTISRLQRTMAPAAPSASNQQCSDSADLICGLKALFTFGHGRPILHEPLTLSSTDFPAEDDSTAEDDALVSGEAPAVIAGIRPEVAAILETRAGGLLLAGPVAPLRVHYLLAWSLLLARLRSLPATSSVYEKLVQ